MTNQHPRPLPAGKQVLELAEVELELRNLMSALRGRGEFFMDCAARDGDKVLIALNLYHCSSQHGAYSIRASAGKVLEKYCQAYGIDQSAIIDMWNKVISNHEM